jgi:hypothetical protein
MQGDEIVRTIDCDIALKCIGCVRIGFECNRSSTTYSGSQHCIATDIRADVEKDVAWTQPMHSERHFGELV